MNLGMPILGASNAVRCMILARAPPIRLLPHTALDLSFLLALIRGTGKKGFQILATAASAEA
ncbi:hypothetical protein EJ05DRAFT_279636 [Pseudovirgaria hyperparasitica]|uniref:Uncharacterized protein n=1 Tax=Pseudovirgaria hyperparasitica TaxID=470096 RepID=A0A6A6WE36_9PEZI|nr:uncharacterized protein EJ05DRAFT_279636 [Pseudovirgaria hyperparasitica]KAF2760324.1 hypothetical protein EJ05DRAFT_279636 [Pseudovirgaria hyperparasitica]